MSTQLGLSQRSYIMLERDEIKISWEKIEEISKIFEIEPADLILFDEKFLFKNNEKQQTQGPPQTITEKLIFQYEERIQGMEKEINFLRELLIKSN